jgi:hypothetical protein
LIGYIYNLFFFLEHILGLRYIREVFLVKTEKDCTSRIDRYLVRKHTEDVRQTVEEEVEYKYVLKQDFINQCYNPVLPKSVPWCC